MKKKFRWKWCNQMNITRVANNLLLWSVLILCLVVTLGVEAKSKKEENWSRELGNSANNPIESNDKLKADSSSAESSLVSVNGSTRKLFAIDCKKLKVGQFWCPSPEIDPATQQPVDCRPDNLAPINCTLREGLICDGDQQIYDGVDSQPSVLLAVACEYTNGYSYEIALLLSIFLGMFGVDRFYLGYPAIGLLKFCTLGFLFLGQFIDIILIAMQIVKPADGSNYVIKMFGPKLNIIKDTFINDYIARYGLQHAQMVTQSSFDIYFYPSNWTTRGNS